MAEPISKTTPETEQLAQLSINSPETTAEKINQKSERKINLKTADESDFLVEESVAREFEIVREFLDEGEFDYNSFIPLTNVTSKYLSKIIDYCKKHQELRAKNLGNPTAGDASDDAKAYDQEFTKDMSNTQIKKLLLAANYLNVRDLLDLLTTIVADRLANKRVEYVRDFFVVENDFTDEELYHLWVANTWAFEDVDSDYYYVDSDSDDDKDSDDDDDEDEDEDEDDYEDDDGDEDDDEDEDEDNDGDEDDKKTTRIDR